MKWNYLAAMNASNPDNYLSFEAIDNPDFENGDEMVDMTEFSMATPEQILLKKEKWELLREETKQVIELLLDCPNEILLEIIGTRKKSYRNQLTPKRIAKYLYKQWEEKNIVNVVMKEIREYIRS